jgi:hypothetical protein
MITTETFRTLALSFPGTSEQAHFEKTAFRTSKRIFATLSQKEHTACLRLTPVDQSVFCSFNKEVIYPLPNKWGRQGWTLIELKKVRKAMLKDALTQAYLNAVPKPITGK